MQLTAMDLRVLLSVLRDNLLEEFSSKTEPLGNWPFLSLVQDKVFIASIGLVCTAQGCWTRYTIGQGIQLVSWGARVQFSSVTATV